MSDLKQYIEAEIREIMDSMDERCRQDPELRKKSAMEWIKCNAEDFRRRWENSWGSESVKKSKEKRDSVSNEIS